MALIKSRIDQLKNSPEALIGHLLQRVVGLLPPAVCLPIWNAVAFKTSISCSNLAGPQRPMMYVVLYYRYLSAGVTSAARFSKISTYPPSAHNTIYALH